MKLFILLIFGLVLSVESGTEDVLPSKTEYERYLDQILLVFDKDPKVKAILKNATPEDIKNGLIEKALKRLHPDIRSKLDEVKRNIIMEYRLKLRKAKMDDNVPDDLYKFQNEDLKHLLNERHERLKAMDEERKRQFKKYEMEKELKHRMALRAMNEYDRKVQEALDLEQKQKKEGLKNKAKHPGNKQQLEEVWEAEGFDKDTFNPKTFFKMHDLNNDGEWDDFELEAVFEKEVDLLFEGFDDVDEEEKEEEVARMREHVIEHVDSDGDGVVQIKEFLEYAKGKEFDHEDPWDTVFSNSFSDDELESFEKTLDEKEKEDIKGQAELEKQKRLETIKKFEADSKINMDMLKEHSQKLREALLAANKAKDLDKAKKVVAEAAKEQAKQADETGLQQHQPKQDKQKMLQQHKEILQQNLEAAEKRQAEQQRQQQIGLEQQRRAQEQIRVAQENAQVERQRGAEQQRVAQEQQRIALEQAQAEQQRLQQIAAEQQRRGQEQQRIAQEQAEKLRVQQEEQRRVEQQRLAEEQQRLAEQHQRALSDQQRQAEEHKQQLHQHLNAIGDYQAQQINN